MSRVRVNFDIETCQPWGGQVGIIAWIEDPLIMKTILSKRRKGASAHPEAVGRTRRHAREAVDELTNIWIR